jgi:hypothetical protein
MFSLRFLSRGAFMKRFTTCLTAVSLFCISTVADALTTYKEVSSGRSANAGFFHDDGCVQTQSDVAYIEKLTVTTNSDGQKFESNTRQFSIFIFQADFCENRIIMFGNGSIGFVPDGSVPAIGNKLENAHIALTVPVFNQANDTEVDVTVDVNLTARTDASTSERVDVVISPDQREKAREDETVRDANISGSISDGITQYAIEPSGNGRIASFSNRVVQK